MQTIVEDMPRPLLHLEDRTALRLRKLAAGLLLIVDAGLRRLHAGHGDAGADPAAGANKGASRGVDRRAFDQRVLPELPRPV